jgi:hypothetical protein
MRLSQIQFLDKGKLTADLSSALAFDSHNLDKLQVRIKDLQHEKAQEKKLFRLVYFFLDRVYRLFESN